LKKEELAARALGVLIYGRRVHAPPPHYYYMYVFCTQGWIMHMQREQTDRPPLQQQLFAQALWIKIWARGNGTHNDNAMNGFCVSIRLE
jgi:hypothetical protein